MNKRNAIALLCIFIASVQAGDAPPAPKKFVPPIPELPAVLLFDDFENPTNCVTYGKLADAPGKTGGKSWQMGLGVVNPGNKKVPAANIEPQHMNLKLPGGQSPAGLELFFNLWTEEDGNLQVTFVGKDKYVKVVPVKAAKTWTPITIKWSEAGKLNTHADEVISKIEMFFNQKGDAPKDTYIDDVLITFGVPHAADILPAIRNVRKVALDAERTWARDGFTFSLQSRSGENFPKPASNAARKKGKSVLVFAPRPGQSDELVKALDAAAPAAKLAGYTFVPADAPDASPVGGLDDMRALIADNLERSQARYVLLLLSYKDAASAGTTAEPARVLVDRVLKSGSIPIVAVPPLLPNAPAKAACEKFAASLNETCAQRGVTVIEAATALKSAAPLAEGELNSDGLKGVAGVAAAALKHLETFLPKRK